MVMMKTYKYESKVEEFLHKNSDNNLTNKNEIIRNHVSEAAHVPFEFEFSYQIGRNILIHERFEDNFTENGIYDAGHKLSAQFGGKGRVSANVIPMNPNLNRGSYKDLKDKIYRDLAKPENRNKKL
jgi:hypothetical protein